MNANRIIKTAGLLAVPLMMLTGLAQVAQADPWGYSAPAPRSQTTVVNVYNTTINNTYISNTYNVNSNNTTYVAPPIAPRPTAFAGGYSGWGNRPEPPFCRPTGHDFGGYYRPPTIEHRGWGSSSFSFSFGRFGR
ncbi:MAG: hypothetical protein PHU85_20415 [Phycisphaerae bacterium]|nr:hypothetical protein [Phycisphaerae bacterium]